MSIFLSACLEFGLSDENKRFPAYSPAPNLYTHRFKSKVCVMSSVGKVNKAGLE